MKALGVRILDWLDRHEAVSAPLVFLVCLAVIGLYIAMMLRMFEVSVHVSFSRP